MMHFTPRSVFLYASLSHLFLEQCYNNMSLIYTAISGAKIFHKVWQHKQGVVGSLIVIFLQI